MTEETEPSVFFVRRAVLPPELAACAVVDVCGTVYRLTIEAHRDGMFPLEVAELDVDKLGTADPWRIKAKGQWFPRPLRGRYVADASGGRLEGPAGDLLLLEVRGELQDEHRVVLGDAAGAAIDLTAAMAVIGG